MTELEYLPPARAIFLTGFMGTGKSTNGARLAERLGLAFVDTDTVVSEAAGKPIPQIFEEDGEEAFRDLESDALRHACSGPRAVVSTGGGAMLRPANVALMRETGPIICLEAQPKTILERTGRKDDRPLLQCSDPLGRIVELLKSRRAAYDQADCKVIADYEDRSILLGEIHTCLAADPRTALLAQSATRVPVSAPNGEYRIQIERGAYSRLDVLCPSPVKGIKCLLVSNQTVAGLYGDEVMDSLCRGGWEPTLALVPEGEKAKTLSQASALYDALIEAGVDSGGAIFALGGGVVGDLGGFAAATFRRGIRFAQLPTTLLSQVDASSGGKVAVNHPRGKNMIGCFYQPSGVAIDTRTLDSLPPRELRSGLAEVIKHAAIADAGLFRFLEERLDDFIHLDEVTTRYVVARNCQIKASIVEKDPFDRGLRACLNYGHTIGHAIERAAGDWDLTHGEAVAIGMVGEARLSLALGKCSEETVARQVKLLEKAGLPTRASGIDSQKAAELVALDKKIAAGKLRLPVVPEIGSFKILKNLDPARLREAVAAALGNEAEETAP